MFHRFSTWWRALSVVLLGLATITWPSASSAATTPVFTVEHQDATAVMSSSGTARIVITLAFRHPSDTTQVSLALYPRIVMRSQIAPIISGAGVSGPAAASTGSFEPDCTASRTSTIAVVFFTGRPLTSRGRCGPLPRLRLACRGATCDGVYPLRYAVSAHGTTTVSWSLVAIQTAPVASPLQFSWITTLGAGTWSKSVRTAAVLTAISRRPTMPLTVSANYETLSSAYEAGTRGAAWRGALNHAVASPLHRIIDAPPQRVDFAGLAANGLGAEVKSQLNLAGQLVGAITGRYLDGPVLLEGEPSAATVAALGAAGVSNVVVPENRLTIEPSTTLTWGSPFHITGGGSPIALTDDQPLSALAVDGAIEPGRRAAIMLATLAFLHFEAPNAPASRSVIVTVPATMTSIPFFNQVAAGLTADPFVVASSLVPSFTSSLVGSDGAPSTRSLLAVPPSHWSARNIATLTALAAQVNSFSQAITDHAVAFALRVATARAESVGGASARQNAINAATAGLNAQLAKFTVDPSAITLAGPGTALPITLHSTASYTITAVVHLLTNQLDFPKGSNVVVTLGAPTTSVRVPTVSHRGSSLTLQVNVTTPDQQVLLAHAAIQVRIAGTSVVGYLLTLASLLVLGAWWWQTYRRRSKGRHAR